MNTTSAKDDAAPSQHELQRKLSNRHLQLIAIGGAIGTGLFMGSGKTISLAGPSILFIYMIIGFMFFFKISVFLSISGLLPIYPPKTQQITRI